MFICEKNFTCCDYQYWDKKEDIDKDALECGHFVEVAKVKHGHWEFNKHQGLNEKSYYCSLCLKGGSDYPVDKYCPNCGAVMDEVDNG